MPREPEATLDDIYRKLQSIIGLLEQSREREWEHHKEMMEALSAIEEAASRSG